MTNNFSFSCRQPIFRCTNVIKIIIFIVFYVLSAIPSTYAQAVWNVASGSFTNSSNWVGNNPPSSSISALINNGGTADVQVNAIAAGMAVGNNTAGNNTVNILSGSTLDLNNGNAVIGNQAGSQGTVKVSDGTLANINSLQVGVAGTGNLNIISNGLGSVETVTDTSAIVGTVSGGTGTVTINGGVWNSPSLRLGQAGNGILTVTNGGNISTTTSILGEFSSGVGTATVDGSTSKWTSNTFTVGASSTSTSTLNIQNGGVITTATTATVGQNAGSSGLVTINGANSTWTANTLNVGGSGSGTLNIANSGLVSSASGNVAESAAGVGTVTIDGNGSMWTAASSCTVGVSGNGTLTLKNGGQLKVANGNGALELATNSGSHGTLNIGSGGTTGAGSIEAAIINGGAGTAIVNFKQSDAFTLAATTKITGSTSINISATGITTFAGRNTYSGQTVVSNGSTLVVNNLTGSATGTGLVGIFGTLSGTGIIDGNTNIIGSGTLKPGTLGDSLHFNHSLDMDAASQLTTVYMNIAKFSPGGLMCDNIEVDGVFSVAGTLNVESVTGGNFAYGDSFQLFTCGSIVGSFDQEILLPSIDNAALFWNIGSLYTTGIITVVPEPATWALMIFGFAGIFCLRRKQIRQS